MMWIIDRIEGSVALCETEDESIINIPLSALPNGVREGDVISISVDKNETERRKKNINSLMDDLFVD